VGAAVPPYQSCTEQGSLLPVGMSVGEGYASVLLAVPQESILLADAGFDTQEILKILQEKRFSMTRPKKKEESRT